MPIWGPDRTPIDIENITERLGDCRIARPNMANNPKNNLIGEAIGNHLPRRLRAPFRRL